MWAYIGRGTEEGALSSPTPARDDIHHSDGPRLVLPWLICLRTVTEKHSESPRTWICTDPSYMLVVFRVRVFQRCWWLVLRWDCDKRNQRARHRCALWFLLWTLICSNTEKWLWRTRTRVRVRELEQVNVLTLCKPRLCGCSVWRVAGHSSCCILVACCFLVFVGAGLVPMCVFHQTSSHLPPHPTALDHRTSRSTPLISLSSLIISS